MSKSDRFQLVGNTIAGTFRVDQVVAEGGFGIVYRAYHLHFRSAVALKCLKIPEQLSEDERSTFLEQFRSEAEIQFRLSAALPNIVRPLHVDAVHTDQGQFVPLMALEWLDGQSFEKIIEDRCCSDLPPLTLEEAMEMISPAAQALHEAHHFESEGEHIQVVHRDIKPDNLFVTEIGGKRTVKLLDFGISKVRRAATQLAGHVSQTGGHAPFSPAYGAPEQWVPKRFGQTGPWTDVWGLALTLVEIIKGDAVIDGDHQAMMGTALDPKVRPSPRSEGVAVSDDVESVFLKALAVDPRYRYQSVQSFWESLGAALERGSTEQQLTPSGRRVPLPKMSAPTPWTPPHLRLKVDVDEVGRLPPMLAPAPLEPTSSDNLREASYPSNPLSDLQPVPPAPTPYAEVDPSDIPPIFTSNGDAPSERSAQRASSLSRISSRPRHDSVGSLELMPTSNFPAPSNEPLFESLPDARLPDIDLQDVTPPRRGVTPTESKSQGPLTPTAPAPPLKIQTSSGPPPPPRRVPRKNGGPSPPLPPSARNAPLTSKAPLKRPPPIPPRPRSARSAEAGAATRNEPSGAPLGRPPQGKSKN